MRCVLIVVTGPIGAGKTTLAGKIAQAITDGNGADVPHFDFDRYDGLEFFGIGKERNDLTNGILRELTATHPIVVISTGGYGVNDFAKKIFEWSKCHKPTILHVAYNYNANNDVDFAITRDTIRDRIASGKFKVPGNTSEPAFIETFVKASHANRKIQEAIEAYTTIGWDRDNIHEVIETMVDLVPHRNEPIPSKSYAKQMRVLVSYTINGNKSFGHITLRYSHEFFEVPTGITFTNPDYRKESIMGRILTATATHDTRVVYKVLAIDNCEFSQFLADTHNCEDIHVTDFFPRNFQCYKPDFASKITKAFTAKQSTVDYITNGDHIATFTITEGDQIAITCHGAFAL
jgi:hypothetical protein